MTSQKGKQFLVGYKSRMPISPSYRGIIGHLILSKNEELSACHPTEQNNLELEKLKCEYDFMYDYITRGNSVRSKATVRKRRKE